jgi:hypothetical protein
MSSPINISINLINQADISGLVNGSYQNVTGMACNSNGQIMYASVIGVGIIKSINSGISWSSTSLSGSGFSSVACSSNGVTVYACNLGDGLYKSTNSGTNWSQIAGYGNPLPDTSPPTNPEVAVGYDFANVDKIACDGTGSKLLMTTNYAAVIYQSSDGGSTWSNNFYIIPNYKTNPNGPVSVASNIDGSVLYCAFNQTTNPPNPPQIYKSINSGITWNPIQSNGGSGSPIVSGPFTYISSNLTGDFCFATDNNSIINIFYDTHSAIGVLMPPSGSTFSSLTCYNNGNYMVVTVGNGGNAYTQTYSITNLYPPGPIPGTQSVTCFKEDSKILCFKDGIEIYMKVQDLRKGDLIKTYKNGYVPLNMIGTRKLYNPSDNLRGKNRLYICKSNKYPELTENLIITGCHSILIDYFTHEQLAKSLEVNDGKVYITDGKYRLPACVDDRCEPYTEEGIFNIWHIALDNNDYYMNYGIYANGLLVESCSKRYLKEYSAMSLI